MTRLTHLLLLTSLLFPLSARAQVTSISGVVNVYTPVVALACNRVEVASVAGFAPGDKVLIIQMKGAEIDLANSTDFGTVTSYNNSGNFEFAIIESIAGTIIQLEAPLLYGYDISGLVQLIRVPQYNTALVTGTLTCAPWNGSVGGVLVIEASTSVQLSASINVDGNGFRGGSECDNPNGMCGGFYNDYYYAVTSGFGAEKGEGIVALPATLNGGRGAQANGGGGGNKHNSGGGGGSNFTRGGRGGNEADFCTSTPIGGEGGKQLAPLPGKIFMGGGGGSSDNNDGVGTPGGNGGGIIIIKSPEIISGGYNISANGSSVPYIVNTIGDGAGGGGAGGSILLEIDNYSGTLFIYANGGDGGDQHTSYGAEFGPGGGGGVGLLMISEATLPFGTSLTTSPGTAGTDILPGSPTFGSSLGAAPGIPGYGLATGYTVTQNFTPVDIEVDIVSTITPCASTAGLSASTTEAGLSFLWSTTDIVQNITVNAPGTYVVMATNTSGCSDSDTIDLVFQPGVDITATGSTDTLCAGEPVNISVINNNGVTVAVYQWTYGGSTGTISGFTDTPAGNTLYILDVTDVNGCTDSDTFALTVLPNPDTVIITHDSTHCLTTMDLIAGPVVAGYIYTWSTGDNDTSITVNTSGVYGITVTNALGLCPATASASINFVPPVDISISDGDDTLCSGETITLSAVNNNGISIFSYNWIYGGSSQEPFMIHTPMATTTYQLVVEDVNGCTDTADRTIIVVATPDASFVLNEQGCAPMDIIFSANNGGYDTYTWNTGDGAEMGNPATHTYNLPGTYAVSLQVSLEGCVTTHTIPNAVVVSPVANAQFMVNHQTGIPFNFQFLPVDPAVNTSYHWDFGDGHVSTSGSPTHSFDHHYSDSVTVCLYADNGLNCPDTFCLEIDRFNLSTLYFPNTFTPNGDGHNEFFQVQGTHIGWYQLYIFNRWGQVVFESNDLSATWDGKHNNVWVETGVYVVKIIYTESVSANTYEIVGHVSLLR